MRITMAIAAATATILTALAGPAAAQTEGQANTAGTTGAVNFGVRFTDVSGDKAAWQRYQDLGDGMYLDRLRLSRTGSDWLFTVVGDHVIREDQRYTLTYKSRGRFSASFVWDQIPIWNSNSTATLYTGAGGGTLRMSEGIRASTQDDRNNLANFIDGAVPLDVRSRRDVARLDVIFSPTREVDLTFNLRNTVREGTQPYGAYNLQPIEVPLPVDTRTTDVGAGLQWANERGRVSVGYQGSWFDNRVATFVWDNPWRLDDSATAGSSQGRMALWPDNTLQTVTGAGAVKMAGRTSLTAAVSLGRGSQDQVLLPFTINTMIEQPTLSRRTAEAAVRNAAVNVNLTSRPRPWVWLSARWRYYDSKNTMPRFENADYIRADQRVSEFSEVIATSPLSFSRNTADLDVSFTPRPFVALRAGYTRNGSSWENRVFTDSAEDVFRVSLDATTLGWLTLRGVVEHGSRTGSGLREDLLEIFEEQPHMRHFDIADRDRTRYTALVQVTPGSMFGASASIAMGKDDYDDAVLGSEGFGLKSYENRRYTLSLDVTPTEQVSGAVWFVRENYEAFQRSRTARPGTEFDDPRRDWMLDSRDNVDTVSAELSLRQLATKVDVRLTYETSRGRATYLHSVVDSSVVGDVEPLPDIRNILDTAILDVSWPLTDRMNLGVMYRYERYDVADFLLDETLLTSLNMSGGMFLGYVYRPYTANGVWLGLSYHW